MNIAEIRQEFSRYERKVAGQDQGRFLGPAMRERRVNSAERAEVFMQIENQPRVAGLCEPFISLDLQIGGVDDYSQSTGGGFCRGDRPLDHWDAVNFEPGLVQFHSRA